MNRLNRLVAFKDSVRSWGNKIGVNPKRVQVQKMTKKWASCSSKGQITFSTDLLKQEKAFREVVIVHELLHLNVGNHGKLFKSLMNAYLPDWEIKTKGRIVQIYGQGKL